MLRAQASPLLCLVFLAVFSAVSVGAHGGLVRDLEGRVVDPLAAATGEAVVLVFVTPDCPISNRLAPELKRIYQDYARRGLDFFLVYSDRDLAPELARRHTLDYGYPFPALLDPGHHLVQKTGATVTPEVAVLSPDGQVLYLGRVNDRYVDFGRTRAQATRHDLREALDAVLAGRPVEQPKTPAVGCYIPPLDP